MGQLVNRPMAMAANRCESHHHAMDKLDVVSSEAKNKVRPLRAPAALRSDSRELRKGFLLSLGGGITLAILFILANFVKLDSLLVASQAIYNVIGGFQGIAAGIGQLLLGLAQMISFAALAVVVVTAALALASGSLRIGWKLLPQLESMWDLLAHSLNSIVQFVSLPLPAPRSNRPEAANSRRAASNQKAA